jgi:hypothetical protein
VRRFLRMLDALPRWLRWILFFPVGAAASLLIVTFVDLACVIAGLPQTPQTAGGMVKTAVIRFAAGLTVTLLPAVLSPRPWPVGVVIFAIGVLMAVSPIVIGLIRHVAPSLMLFECLELLEYALGAGLALFLVSRAPGDKAQTDPAVGSAR